MAKQIANQDRNFDGLAERFRKNVYGGLKGAIRLAVLERDFTEFLPEAFAPQLPQQRLRILDAGGGQGQFSLQLARAGHELVICDISREMLALAQTEVNIGGLNASVTLLHCAIQDLPEKLENCAFDVVLCHAVIEWMAEPQTLLPCLFKYLKPDGLLSLTYYNRAALILKNLLRGNFQKVSDEDFTGSRGSLTPINPIDPQQFEQWMAVLDFSVITRSGIRVFHDYIFDAEVRARDEKNLLAMELQFSRQEPYRALGRYVHILARKNPAGI